MSYNIDRINCDIVDQIQYYLNQLDLRVSNLEKINEIASSPKISVPYGLMQIKETFGDPSKDPESYEKENIVSLQIPFSMPLSWDINVKTNKIKCHKLIKPILSDIFKIIYKTNKNNELIKNYGGCYCHRAKSTNPKELSIHSFGTAIDLNIGMIQPVELINLFTSYGFEWGGNWKKPDTMHFQYCTGY